jgi:hypothetical protein
MWKVVFLLGSILSSLLLGSPGTQEKAGGALSAQGSIDSWGNPPPADSDARGTMDPDG